MSNAARGTGGTTRRVFVSHAHADNALCDRYVAALRAQGVDVWYDRTNLQSGSALSAEIERELQARTAFVVLLSPAAVASYWVRLEIDAYRELAARDPARLVVPVRIAPCEIPVLLRGLLWVEAAGSPFDAVIAELVAALRAPAQPEAPRGQSSASQTSGQASLVCPRCSQLDQVRKVSSIASDRRLAAPSNPVDAVRGYDPGRVGITNYTVAWTVLFMVGSVVALFAFLIALGALVGGSTPEVREQAKPVILVVIAIWCAWCFLWIAMIRRRARRAERQRQQAIEQVRAKAQAQVPAWERAMATWRQLYYCGRDDMVFIPGKPNTLVPAEQMARLLA
jgi:hypothetical protein